MVKSTTRKTSPSDGYRIGAVAALSGVPVPTLRVWEARYGTFSPRMTQGGQRLYTDEDVLRATLLKRLTEHGHSISSIANHDATKLNTLLQQQDTTQRLSAIKQAERQTLNVVVVGVALAARLASKNFKQIFASSVLHTSAVYEDLDAALAQAPSTAPDFLLVQVNAVHAIVQAQLHRLISQNSQRATPQVIVLHRFGQEHVAESMKRSGMVVRREPVSDYELSDLFRSSMLLDAQRAMEQTGLGATIPPRKYTDATLARMATTSTNILCECPRHVAEIIAQLVSFEQYSQDCLNKSTEDAHLHAYLHSVSGSARALFEHALQMVADHEGLKLQDTDESPLA